MIFDNQQLDVVAEQLQQLEQDYTELYHRIKENANQAFKMRWLSGRLIVENLDLIKRECGTVRAFSEKIGVQEAYLSNNKRAYEALREFTGGGETESEWDKVIDVMNDKEIRPTVFNLERLPKLLNEPKEFRLIEQRTKDEKRLEIIYEELEEIRLRNESAANNRVVELAGDTLKYAKELKPHLSQDDPYRSDWRSEYYLNWVKSLGRDYITWKPSAQLDPHHTLPDGSSGGFAMKVADVFVIPVTRETHNAIESGTMKVTKEQHLEALVKTMANFIITHHGE